MNPPRPPPAYEISSDPARLDLDAIHAFLSRAYWARDRTREQLERAVANSLCFGAYHRGALVGFARVVTDRAVTAHLLDVFVLEAYRGHGVGKRLVDAALGHPELAACRWTLFTADAHDWYARWGFERQGAERLMRRPPLTARPLRAHQQAADF